MKMDIKLICKEDKCDGAESGIISTNNNAKKTDIKKLVEVFELKPHKIVETNEEKVTDEQREIINKIIG